MLSDAHSKPPTSDVKSEKQIRTYKRGESAVFSKTKEGFGGLSNMAAGFPITVNGVHILTSEALYQACRFPHLPQVQRLIIQQSSPMTAKMKSKPYRNDSRPDWERVRVKIMRWCLRVKLAQNWSEFSRLLLATGDRAIVEESRRDDFWGAKVVDAHTLTGMNVLGRLLMELREEIKQRSSEQFRYVEPVALPNFSLLGKPIVSVEARLTGRDAVPDLAPAPEHVVNPIQRQLELAGVASGVENPLLLVSTDPQIGPQALKRKLIDALKPYPEYKDSGLPWLRSIPAHWDEKPGIAVLREKSDKNTGLKERRVLSLSYGRIVVKPEEKLHGLVPDSFETYQIVNPGDIIVRSTDLQNDWTSLRVGLVRDRGIITSAYMCLRVLGLLTPHFAFLLLHSYDLRKFFYGLGSGLRQNLSFNDFKRLPFPIPPPCEQRTIGRFIDHANRQIERYIRAKRKLIALLNEQKQAIINHVVTRGLDPDVSLKDSGIPWLGKVPTHWDTSRLKFETSHIVDCLHATPLYVPDGEFPAIRTADVEPGKLRLSRAKRVSEEQFKLWTSRLAPKEGDILYSREGERFGIAALVPNGVRLCISQRMMVFRIKSKQCNEFIMWQLNCPHVYAQASADIIGSTSPHVNVEQIKNYRLLIPPRDEQEKIVQQIHARTSNLDRATFSAAREIELLREYHARLIADVVTGQLDVREAAARLPEEMLEPEPLYVDSDDLGSVEAGEPIEDEP